MADITEIEQVVVGSILDEDVLNAQGMVLLKKGTAFEEKHAKILKRWGIKKIAVIEPQVAEQQDANLQEVIAEKTAELETSLEHMFEPHAGNELMQKLKKIVHEVRLAALTKSTHS